MKKSLEKTLEKRCDNWNHNYPIGTEVEYHSIIGREYHTVTTTTSTARVANGNVAIIYIKSETGYVALDACIPVCLSHTQKPERTSP